MAFLGVQNLLCWQKYPGVNWRSQEGQSPTFGLACEGVRDHLRIAEIRAEYGLRGQRDQWTN